MKQKEIDRSVRNLRLWNKEMGFLLIFILAILPGYTHSAISRSSDATSGKVSRALSALNTGKSVAITAIRDGNGDLRLESWRVGSTGSIQALHSAVAGAITQVKTALLRPQQFVTAVRQSDGNLAVIVWSVSDSGQIRRLSKKTAGAVSRLSVARYTNGKFITAVRDGSGDLRLISWEVSSNGDIQRLNSSSNAGSIVDLSMEFIGGERVVTGVRMPNNKLKLILWRINSSGAISRLTDSQDQAGEINHINMRAISPRYLLTAISERNTSNLKLILWDIQNNKINRLNSSEAGRVGRISVSSKNTPNGEIAEVFTGVQTSNSKLKLISWDFNSSDFELGQSQFPVLRRGDSAGAGGIRLVDTIYLDEADVVLTVIQDDQDNLKLISWKSQGTSGPR